MKTTEKGDIGVIKIMDNLIIQGINVFMPFSANLPFDIVAYTNNKFYRIQVKYRKMEIRTAIQIYVDKSSICNNHISRKKYTENDFDILAVYCPDNNECYFIPKNIFDSRTITLRMTPPKNNQKTKIKYASDFMNFNNSILQLTTENI